MKFRPKSPPAGRYSNIPFQGIENVPQGNFNKPARRLSFGPIIVGGHAYRAERLTGIDERGGTALFDAVCSLFGRDVGDEDVDPSSLVGTGFDLIIAPGENGSTVLAGFAPSGTEE